MPDRLALAILALAMAFVGGAFEPLFELRAW